MASITVAHVTYRIVAAESDGQWTAHAERADTGERFGVECAGGTETEAAARVGRWIEWQQEHAAALEALQRAERAYHRAIAGSAFTSPTEGPSAVEIQRESLEQVEAARERLDDVRARNPA